MKKKGLIISTVVMVVVLIASLTTATYAWFSSTSTVSVDNFNMTTSAMEGLSIGVRNTEVASTGIDGYANGEVTYGTAWTGAAGMGSTITLGAPFITNGFAHATTKYDAANFGEGKMYAADTTLPDGVAAGQFITAQKYNTTVNPDNPTPTEFKASVANTDYLDVELGIRATAQDVKQIWYTITVEFYAPADFDFVNELKPGMAAALMFEITIDGTTTTVNAFNDYTLGTAFTKVTDTTNVVGKTTEGTESTLWKWEYSGWVYNSADTAIDDSITSVAIKAWIEGSDDACRTRTAGTGGTVGIEFAYNAEAAAKTITAGVLA